MKRREFIGKAGLAAAAGAGILAGCAKPADKPAESKKAAPVAKKFDWKMVTSWPPNFPILQTGTEQMAERIKVMSGGRLNIKIYAGGELVPPLGVFDAVSAGTVEMGNGAAYYWAGKVPEAQFFTSAPFGLLPQQMNAWLYHGGGLELYQKVYAAHNMMVFPITNTGVQMAGWFNKEINTIDDFKGLKMRAPGLGGKVMAKAGVNVVLLPGSELYTALERGVIDAVDWAGPYHDITMGFHRAAKYYYYPGWHEPSGVCELTINMKAWESLPDDLQQIVRSAAAENHIKTVAEFDTQNMRSMKELKEKYNVQVKKFPPEVLAELHKLTDQTLEEEAAKNPKFSEVYEAFKKFRADIDEYSGYSEFAFIDAKGV